MHPGLDQGRRIPTPGAVAGQLGSGDSGNLLETVASESQEEGVATATEPVLRGLKNSATFKVLVLRLYGKVHHGIDHVLKLIRTCLLYTSPSPRDATLSRMPSSA